MGMLVLSRKLDKAVVITVPPSAEQTEVRILIAGVTGDIINPKVKLGFLAPRDVVIDRSEIHALKLQESADVAAE